MAEGHVAAQRRLLVVVRAGDAGGRVALGHGRTQCDVPSSAHVALLQRAARRREHNFRDVEGGLNLCALAGLGQKV